MAVLGAEAAFTGLTTDASTPGRPTVPATMGGVLGTLAVGCLLFSALGRCPAAAAGVHRLPMPAAMGCASRCGWHAGNAPRGVACCNGRACAALTAARLRLLRCWCCCCWPDCCARCIAGRILHIKLTHDRPFAASSEQCSCITGLHHTADHAARSEWASPVHSPAHHTFPCLPPSCRRRGWCSRRGRWARQAAWWAHLRAPPC